MASNRFRADNARLLVAALRERGIDATATAVAPSTRWHIGCSDPDCCAQHPGRHHNGEPMLSVKTRVSTRALLRLAAEIGLTLIH